MTGTSAACRAPMSGLGRPVYAGEHELRGVPGTRRLYRVRTDA